MVHPLAELGEAIDGFRPLDLLAPGIDDRRPDDFHDIDRAGEMGTEGMAFGLFGRMLEKRAEDLRPHL